MVVSVATAVIGRCDLGRPGAGKIPSYPPLPRILRNRNDVDFILVAFDFTTAHREETDSGWCRMAS